MNNATKNSAAICAFLATTALATPALAQSITNTAFPDIEQVDKNGVDVTTGTFVWSGAGLAVGEKDSGLTVTREIRGAVYNDTLLGAILPSGYNGKLTVSFGSIRDEFTYTNQPSGPYTPVVPRGQTLTFNSSTQQYTYTDPNGTVLTFDNINYSFGDARYPSILTATYPNGLQLTFYYNTTSTLDGGSGRRLYSVVSNSGWHIKFSYDSANGISSVANAPAWSHVTIVTALNNLADPCATNVNTCSVSFNKYPFYSTGSYNATQGHYCDAVSRCTYFTFGGPNKEVSAVQYPGSSSANVSISYGTSDGKISQVIKEGVTTSYTWSDFNGVRTLTATTGGNSRVYTSNISTGRVLSITDELGHQTSYQWDASKRLTQVTYPEGNYVTFTYDGRSNVTNVTRVAKPGSPLANLVTSATYASSCVGNLACNKPTTTTDARGNSNSYAYEAHGLLTTVTSPAPIAGAVQPQTRYTYQQLDPTSGAASSSGIFRLVQMSNCQTTASCIGTADEVRKTITYGRNLLPSSETNSSGDGSLLATTTTTYDDVGNATAKDGPLAGTGDTSHYRYDQARQLIGTISPDPDGTGPLSMRAVRYTYSDTGPVKKIETGTVAGLADTDWSAMTVLQVTNRNYDSNGRLTYESGTNGTGSVLSLTEYSYDSFGRSDCVAQRMNLSITPGTVSACSLSTQAGFGPDRISKSIYDATDEVTQVQVGVATSDAATERTLTYTPNGKLSTIKDGENNLTTNLYDGFDQLGIIDYPSATKGAGTSNPSDNEQFAYDANGNLTTYRNRAGALFNYGYDNLNRRTSKGGAIPTVNYTYDNLGRQLSATFSSSGQGITNTYDALSRLTSTTTNLSGTAQTLSYQYNLAGNRTQLTYPDGHYLNYDHLVTGEVSAIRLNGSTSGVGVIGSYAYDALGNRSSVTFGGGSSTTYTYDPIGRLATLNLAFPGGANNLTKTFAYNPASGMVSETRSNDSYAWNGAANFTRGYTSNGLNQYPSTTSANYTYDANGNLTSDGTNSFAYDAENHMTFATVNGVASTLTYDPLGRLWRLQSGSTDDRYVYDGGDMVAVYHGSTFGADWMFGPGVDEPIAAVVSGASPTGWLHADERGSIIARTDPNGNVNLIQSYDEYGIPSPSNATGFQYTGQLYFSQLGMYYYKSRMYSTTLGRFMQTDSIGYGDGPNWYAYTHNDPVNGSDPTGESDDTFLAVTTQFNGEQDAKSFQDEILILAQTIVVTGQRIRVDYTNGGLNFVDDLLGAFDRAQDVFRGRGGSFGGGGSSGGGGARGSWGTPTKCGCFEAGTLVATVRGLRPIEAIKAGDLVLSQDERTGSIAAKKVIALIRPEPKQIFELKLVNGSGAIEDFHVTADHRWLVHAKGWIETDNLKAMDQVETGAKADLSVVSVSRTALVEPTYNLEVADWHTFMVGNDRVVVHNACAPAAAYKVLRAIKAGQRMPGLKGGQTFSNREGRLPAGGSYKEYDVNPRGPTGRDSERVVYDETTGRAWYTPDHYSTFIPM